MVTRQLSHTFMVPGAKYVTGKPRPEDNRWNLDKSFSGLVMFGFHAMMGTPDGVLNHTQSSKTENRYWYNGVESGELAQTATVAGYFWSSSDSCNRRCAQPVVKQLNSSETILSLLQQNRVLQGKPQSFILLKKHIKLFTRELKRL